MNKKGFLLGEETLKLLLGVLGISVLIVLLVAIYFSYNSSQKVGQAKETLSFIISEANADRNSVIIYNPSDWWILSSLNDQLCICEKEDYSTCKGKSGTCQQSDISVPLGIQIKNPPLTISIDQQNKILTKGK